MDSANKSCYNDKKHLEGCTVFRTMRRNKQQLPGDEALALLRAGSHGVLSLLGDDDYPYGVPLSYFYEDGKLYFHCATAGHKLDAIRKHTKASFCVVSQDIVVPEAFTTHYKSVIAFGEITLLSGEEKCRAITLLGKKYNPGATDEALSQEIGGAFDRMELLCLTIHHMTGKQCKDLIGT